MNATSDTVHLRPPSPLRRKYLPTHRKLSSALSPAFRLPPITSPLIPRNSSFLLHLSTFLPTSPSFAFPNAMSAFVTSASSTVAVFPAAASRPTSCPPSIHRPTIAANSFAGARLSLPSPSAAPPSTAPRCSVAIEKIANRSFQLEEDEDAASCASAVYLSADGSISMGRTDGPVPERVSASWKYNQSEGEVLLDIERVFKADSGLEFSVKRILRGHLDDSRKNLEDLPVFTGGMYNVPADFSKNSEVGWFALILATDDLPSDDYDISTQ